MLRIEFEELREQIIEEKIGDPVKVEEQINKIFSAIKLTCSKFQFYVSWLADDETISRIKYGAVVTGGTGVMTVEVNEIGKTKYNSHPINNIDELKMIISNYKQGKVWAY